MKIEVEVTRKFTVDMQLSDDDIVNIVEQYQGKVKRWTEEHIDDEIDALTSYSIEQEIEDIEYCNEELFRKYDYIKEQREMAFKHRLNARSSIELMKHKMTTPKALIDYKEVSLDIEALEKASHFVDFENPRKELDYIYINNNIITATNTKHAIKIQSKININAQILLPIAFIQLLKDSARVYISPSKDNKIHYHHYVVVHENNWFEKNDYNASYPDLSRIMDIELNEQYKSHKYSLELFSKVMIDKVYEAIKISINEKQYYIAKEDNLFEYFEINEIFIHEKQSYPLFFYNDNLKIAVMPIVLDENSIVDELR